MPRPEQTRGAVARWKAYIEHCVDKHPQVVWFKPDPKELAQATFVARLRDAIRGQQKYRHGGLFKEPTAEKLYLIGSDLTIAQHEQFVLCGSKAAVRQELSKYKPKHNTNQRHSHVTIAPDSTAQVETVLNQTSTEILLAHCILINEGFISELTFENTNQEDVCKKIREATQRFPQLSFSEACQNEDTQRCGPFELIQSVDNTVILMKST